MLQELKAQIESSDRTKFKAYKLMNPSLTVHKIYEMQAYYVEEHVRLSFSRFRLGSHYLRNETGRDPEHREMNGFVTVETTKCRMNNMSFVTVLYH